MNNILIKNVYVPCRSESRHYKLGHYKLNHWLGQKAQGTNRDTLKCKKIVEIRDKKDVEGQRKLRQEQEDA